MSQNHEFIKNRSFEIAWAVFRCASLVKRESLKKELENNAIALVSAHGNFKPQKHTLENFKNLSEVEKLNAVIKLAEAIGEIKIVNARVLYRELNNLSEAIKNVIYQFEQELARQANEDVIIEDIFVSRGDVKQQSQGKEKIFHEVQNDKDGHPEGNPEGSQSFIKEVKSASDNSIKLAVNNSANTVNSQINKAISGINSLAELAKGVRQNMNKSANILPNKPIAVQQNSVQPKYAMSSVQSQSQGGAPKLVARSFAESTNSKPAESPVTRFAEREEDSIQDSWQNLIYRKIREIGKTSTKEIASFFPEISERTVRFYLQRLTDAKFIEKIGTTGPGSYYVFKK